MKPPEKLRITQALKNLLYESARKAAQKAYSPYSQAKVGAALWFGRNHLSSGCNIENVSFGATVCAERVALWSYLKDHPNKRWKALCVYTNSSPPWPPCGLCLQVLQEFATPNSVVFLANSKGIQEEIPWSKLFPQTFTREHLKRLK